MQTRVPSGALVLGALGTLVGIDMAMAVGSALASLTVLVRAPALRAAGDPSPQREEDTAASGSVA